MGAAELLAVEVHLDQAMDQLEKARVLARQLDGVPTEGADGEEPVDAWERLRLNEIAASAETLIRDIATAIAGEDIDDELQRLLIEDRGA